MGLGRQGAAPRSQFKGLDDARMRSAALDAGIAEIAAG
jgi:hypothetical protein